MVMFLLEIGTKSSLGPSRRGEKTFVSPRWRCSLSPIMLLSKRGQRARGGIQHHFVSVQVQESCIGGGIYQNKALIIQCMRT